MKTTNNAGLSPAAATECQQVLDRLFQKTPAAVFASLTTVDGRSVAFAASQDNIEGQRVAAVSSSLLALSEAFGREILQSECSYNAIATNHGFIVTIRVPTQSKQHAFSFCADKTENMAMTMRLTFDTAEGLAKILDQA